MGGSGGGGVTVGGGGLVYSPQDEIVVGKRTIKVAWRERYLPEREIDGGYVMKGGLADLLSKASGEPALVYFYSSSMDAEKRADLEHKMFGRFDVVLASRYFQCIRVDVDMIKNEGTRERLAPKVPTLYVLKDDGEILEKSYGPVAPGALLQGLHNAYHTQYSQCFTARLNGVAANLRLQTSIGIDLDKIQRELAENLEKQSKRESASRTRKIERARTQLAGLKEKLDALEAQEDELLKPISTEAKPSGDSKE